MGLALSTPPAETPLSLAEIKTHLRVVSTAEDDLIRGLLAAAVDYVERFTRRQLVTATYTWTLETFPSEEFVVPRPPLQSVSSIQYVDTGGETQTLSTDDYTVVTSTLPGRIYPAYGVSWPSTREVPEAVTVTYVAGFGDAGDVPEMLKTAIRLLVAHWYEHREATTETRIEDLPLGLQSILWLYRVPEV